MCRFTAQYLQYKDTENTKEESIILVVGTSDGIFNS